MDLIQSNYDVYAKYVSMFTGYKLVELREIAKRMNLVGRTTMKKGDLAHNIAVTVLGASEDAFNENTYVCMICGERVSLVDQPEHFTARHAEPQKDVFEHEGMRFTGLSFKARTDGYRRQNGGHNKLTRRQQRRAAKKFKNALGRGFSLQTVMGDL